MPWLIIVTARPAPVLESAARSAQIITSSGRNVQIAITERSSAIAGRNSSESVVVTSWSQARSKCGPATSNSPAAIAIRPVT